MLSGLSEHKIKKEKCSFSCFERLKCIATHEDFDTKGLKVFILYRCCLMRTLADFEVCPI